MPPYRIAVVDVDDTVFQYRDAFQVLEDAPVKLGQAQVEYPTLTARVEELVALDADSSEWAEVTG